MKKLKKRKIKLLKKKKKACAMRVVRCVCGRLRARRVAGGWMEAPDATASDPVQGARQGCSVGVSGTGSGVRTGSALPP